MIARFATLAMSFLAILPLRVSAQKESFAEWQAVNVKAALLWREPHPAVAQRRQFPFLSTSNLTVAQRRSLGASETQLLYGELAHVIAESGTWVKVEIPLQPKRDTKNGYTAWIEKKYLTAELNFLDLLSHVPKVVVMAKEAVLFEDAELTQPLLTLSYGTKLPLIETMANGYRVSQVDGKPAYLASSVAQTWNQGEYSPDRLITQAEKLKGIRYVWGGTSAEGFDCSGFAYRLFQTQGITLPRNANDQIKGGEAVPLADLARGDLLYFELKGKGTGVDHVALFIGSGQFIHSPDVTSAVRIENFSPYWKKVFAAARRYTR